MNDVVDATEPEKVRDGRWNGDLDAVLTYDPCAKKPYLVTAWIWQTRGNDDQCQWRATARGAFGFYGDLEHEKYFTRLDKAVTYLYAIKARAETERLYGVVRVRTETRREVLL